MAGSTLTYSELLALLGQLLKREPIWYDPAQRKVSCIYCDYVAVGREYQPFTHALSCPWQDLKDRLK